MSDDYDDYLSCYNAVCNGDAAELLRVYEMDLASRNGEDFDDDCKFSELSIAIEDENLEIIKILVEKYKQCDMQLFKRAVNTTHEIAEYIIKKFDWHKKWYNEIHGWDMLDVLTDIKGILIKRNFMDLFMWAEEKYYGVTDKGLNELLKISIESNNMAAIEYFAQKYKLLDQKYDFIKIAVHEYKIEIVKYFLNGKNLSDYYNYRGANESNCVELLLCSILNYELFKLIYENVKAAGKLQRELPEWELIKTNAVIYDKIDLVKFLISENFSFINLSFPKQTDAMLDVLIPHGYKPTTQMIVDLYAAGEYEKAHRFLKILNGK